MKRFFLFINESIMRATREQCTLTHKLSYLRLFLMIEIKCDLQ